jgi:hypothetical protein
MGLALPGDLRADKGLREGEKKRLYPYITKVTEKRNFVKRVMKKYSVISVW